MKHQAWRFMAFAVVVLFLSLEALADQACNVIVREGMSIQAAIALAPEGGVVCLQEGVWRENIVIVKSLTLRGAGASGQTTISGAFGGSAPVIRVEGDQETEVTIEGVAVSWGPIGIAVVGSAQVTIANSAVRFCGWGIAIAGSAQATIMNSSVTGCQGYGIYITDSARATIHATEVESNEGLLAVYVDASAAASLTASMISGNRYKGVVVGNKAHMDIRDTLIENNGSDGVTIGGSARVTIIGSTVVGNKWRGIAIGDSAHVTLSGNRVAANAMYGVFLYERPCADTDFVFSGYLTGHDNVIPGMFEPVGMFQPEGNKLGAVCPPVLMFLVTEEGGELDRRQ